MHFGPNFKGFLTVLKLESDLQQSERVSWDVLAKIEVRDVCFPPAPSLRMTAN